MFADEAEGAVEERVGGALEDVLFPGAAHAVDDLRAVAPGGDEVGEDLRRVLEVAVHLDHRAAACVVEAGCERGLVAEVAREAEDAHARIVLVEPAQHARGFVGAASSTNRIS